MTHFLAFCVAAILYALFIAFSPVSAGMCFLPPPQYDHEPDHPYTISYGMWPRPYAEIGGSKINLPNRYVKWIFNPNNSYPCLIRHEKGHINGWPQNHPNMITVQEYD